MLVAFLLLPGVAAVFLMKNPAVFFALVLAGLLAAAWEMGQLLRKQQIHVYGWTNSLAVVAMVAVSGPIPYWFGGVEWLQPLTKWTVVAGAFLVLGLQEMRRGVVPASLPTLGANALVILLVGGTGSYITSLRLLPHGSWWLLLLFGINWLYDASALVVGRLWGKHALAPLISPSKTWEGFLGGALITVVIGTLAAAWGISKQVGVAPLALAGVFAVQAVLAQAGDLLESLFKRWAQMKDSSGLIPGHGGILDKVDSCIYSAPFLYWLATWLHWQ
jgi:phosphatidate cytidylyltransferase